MYTTSVYTQTAHMCAHTAHTCIHTAHMCARLTVQTSWVYTSQVYPTCICNVHRIHVHTAHTGTHCTHMYTTSHVCVQTTHTCAHTTPCTRTYTRVQTSHMCAHTVHMHVHTLTPIPPRSLNAAFLAHKLSRPLCVPLDLMGVWSLSLSLPLKEAGCPRALTVTPTWSCIRWAWGPPASARWNPRLWDRPWHPA